MEKYVVSTAEELQGILHNAGPDALFRGQVEHYGVGDVPKMNTSFARNGCTPPVMLRWSHYAGFLLAALLGRDHRDVSLEFTQAVLQHYGWRSFFLDGSSDSAVSAWFAAHKFSGNRSIELCEDCFEKDVALVKMMARYEFEEGVGYLYVLSKSKIVEGGLDVVDLSSIDISDCRPRFHAQQAWLIGPLQGNLPPDATIAMIEAPRSVFRDYARDKGFIDTNHLFPNVDEDPILEFFTAMPWIRRRFASEKKNELSFYEQALELPRYHGSYRKNNPPYIACYDGDFSSVAEMAPNVIAFEAPEIIVYGYANPVANKFPRLSQIVKGEGQHFVFEIDSLIRRPGPLSTEYLKGVAISKCEGGLFAVADLMVKHPGCHLTGCGINMGWHYRIAGDGTWVREVTDDDCPCGNNSTHEHHLSMLTILEQHLRAESAAVVRRPVSDAG
ncbi:hypothetical protein [Aurantimonas coralicida]|uniref:hypothetical protein n=1 Tax=Aurantimonas coralicida TaxID=182270 RepID=UPI0023A29DA6|nr:hypothetical protein [Aurantimonas coralicida]MDE0925155.1 hypothetical protein [Aurantimonas coralicida]